MRYIDSAAFIFSCPTIFLKGQGAMSPGTPQEPDVWTESSQDENVPRIFDFAAIFAETYRAHQQAKSAAERVPRKLTASLLSHPGPSKTAPKRLSTNMPITAAAATTHLPRPSTKPANAAASAMTIAARVPLSVPAREMPPFVPTGTRAPVVRSRVGAPKTCPHSLETVSAAASARAAAQPASQEA